MKVLLLFLGAAAIAIGAIAVAVACLTYLAAGIAVIVLTTTLIVLSRLPPWVLLIVIVYAYALGYREYRAQRAKRQDEHTLIGGEGDRAT